MKDKMDGGTVRNKYKERWYLLLADDLNLSLPGDPGFSLADDSSFPVAEEVRSHAVMSGHGGRQCFKSEICSKLVLF
jgi:hypothetical protein